MAKSNFKAPLIHSTQAARLDKLDEQYGAQEKLDRAVTVASTYAATAIEKAPRYVENVTTDPRGAALALGAGHLVAVRALHRADRLRQALTSAYFVIRELCGARERAVAIARRLRPDLAAPRKRAHRVHVRAD